VTSRLTCTIPPSLPGILYDRRPTMTAPFLITSSPVQVRPPKQPSSRQGSCGMPSPASAPIVAVSRMANAAAAALTLREQTNGENGDSGD